ncbi:hypothetical protein M0R45_008767 [Rubus argutus]|uniref:WW domain containing adaptor with coiled-coil n=1 Tax=Rubus argutus TaxID=59490 RepID=A0AAW1Y2M9_RUBAR
MCLSSTAIETRPRSAAAQLPVLVAPAPPSVPTAQTVSFQPSHGPSSLPTTTSKPGRDLQQPSSDFDPP